METTREVETTATDLGSLLDAGDSAVVTLVAGNTRLVAHRAVLAARSPVFAEMLKHKSESSDGQVCIPDVEGPVLRQLLAYCYTLQAPQLPDMALKLLVAADKYGVPVLKAECERQVAAQLSETLLRQAVTAYVKTHLVEAMATLGWADTVRTQPEDAVRLSQLLSESSAPVCSVPAPAVGGASPPPTSQPHSDGSRTPASAAPPTAVSCHSPPPDGTAVTLPCAPAPAAVGTSRASQPHSEQAACSRSPASAAAPLAAPSRSPPPDDAVVSRLRRLSAKEKNRRLREAAVQGAVGELEALLVAGADVGAADEWGWTALRSAACRGHKEAVRRLLAAGAAVGARDIGQQTALHWAASEGHAAVVRLLLAAGADHSDRAVGGFTALHYAAMSGHTKVVAVLLQAGAEWTAMSDKGMTPLDIARQKRHWQVVHLLQRWQPPPH